jgi:hypothetical protein
MAKQVVFLENNIWKLPEDERMRKRVERSTSKIRATFESLGYEMPKLLGTEIFENQQIDVDNEKEEDPSVPLGKEIICFVNKAQILFEGKTISRPSVKVKINPENS